MASGVEEPRDGRALSLAKGIASGYGSANTATAKVHGNEAQASGSTNGAGPGQGQVITDARYYDAEQAGIDIARAQGYYHPYPVAQPAYITYNQNIVPAEQLVYQPLSVAPASAESSATTNGDSESSLSTANNYGSNGVAQSNAQTSGNFGTTSTNAKTFGQYNTAISNANTGLGVSSVSSKASSNGQGVASSNAQTNANGIVGVAPLAPQLIVEPSVIDAKNQGFYNPSLYGSASSNANVAGYGSADSSARLRPASRSISWRFGTAYDIPAGYGAIKSTPVVYQPAPIVYEAVPAVLSPYGTANSNARTQGAGSAQSDAKLTPGFGSIRSTANSNVHGSANADANINNNQYSLYRSGAIGSGVAKTAANTNGLGFADANANLNNGGSVAKSVANSNGGFANSNADIINRGSGFYRSGAEFAPWSRTITDAKTSGTGSALSNAQANQYGWKSADSSAKSNGFGSSIAHSQSL